MMVLAITTEIKIKTFFFFFSSMLESEVNMISNTTTYKKIQPWLV